MQVSYLNCLISLLSLWHYAKEIVFHFLVYRFYTELHSWKLNVPILLTIFMNFYSSERYRILQYFSWIFIHFGLHWSPSVWMIKYTMSSSLWSWSCMRFASDPPVLLMSLLPLRTCYLTTKTKGIKMDKSGVVYDFNCKKQQDM